MLISYYSFVGNTNKQELFQKRLKVLLQNKTVSEELETTAFKFSHFKFSKINQEAVRDEHETIMKDELKQSQILADTSEMLLDRELEFQAKNINLRWRYETG